MPNRIPFNKISFSETSRSDALECIDFFCAEGGKPSYIGVLNVFMAMSANSDLPELISYYNNSFLTVPDGMPLVWYGRALGYTNVQRTCGPDFLVDVLELSGEKDYSHYFIGSTPETLAEKLELLIRDPDLRRSFGEAGRKRYEQKFTLEIFEQRMAEILTKLVAGC